jgi:hypothetical protein
VSRHLLAALRGERALAAPERELLEVRKNQGGGEPPAVSHHHHVGDERVGLQLSSIAWGAMFFPRGDDDVFLAIGDRQNPSLSRTPMFRCGRNRGRRSPAGRGLFFQ